MTLYIVLNISRKADQGTCKIDAQFHVQSTRLLANIIYTVEIAQCDLWRSWLTLFILIDFPMHVDRMR